MHQVCFLFVFHHLMPAKCIDVLMKVKYCLCYNTIAVFFNDAASLHLTGPHTSAAISQAINSSSLLSNLHFGAWKKKAKSISRALLVYSVVNMYRQRTVPVSVVHYDLTSSEDELSDSNETEQARGFILASARLSPPCLAVSDCDVSEVEDGEQPPQVETASVVEVLCNEDTGGEDTSKVDGPAAKKTRLHSSSAESSSSDQETTTEAARGVPASIVISSSSCSSSSSAEEEEEEEEEEEVAKGVLPHPVRKPYAVKMCDLPAGLREFLRQAESFFTRPHSLAKLGQHVSNTTYVKAQERMLCK